MADRRSILLLRLAIVGGVVALGYYFSWWLTEAGLRSFWYLAWLAAAALYSAVQLGSSWLLYWLARRPSAPQHAPVGLSVDVFVAAHHEPLEMVRTSLQAACTMRGDHVTWLLDDGPDPALASLAAGLGARYLTRQDRVDAKAGNLNEALARSHGEVVVVFDVDHVPRPDFLEHTLGLFSDPQMGFVQVMLTFSNNDDSWVARAAAETSLDYYNPTSLGTHGIGGATLMGSNALIRREALESIGGYRPGLAEDLATSLALHAAGWKSTYVAEPLAPGLAPPDLTAWFTQQLKWARGVFELLLTDFPRALPRLTWGQRLSYAVRMTKYWVGPAVAFHLLVTIAMLTFAGFDTRAIFHSYLDHVAPLVFADVLIRHLALRAYRHPEVRGTSLLRAITLVYATWPIYLYAWLLALLRLRVGFRSTPKEIRGGLNPLWLAPQILAVALLIAGILYTVLVLGHPASVLLLTAIGQGVLQLLLLYRWLQLELGLRRAAPQARTQVEPAASYESLDPL
jgi:cellulose synthase (UDP-forming)